MKWKLQKKHAYDSGYHTMTTAHFHWGPVWFSSQQHQANVGVISVVINELCKETTKNSNDWLKTDAILSNDIPMRFEHDLNRIDMNR